ncbi:MAG: hypothetical protein ABSE89_04080 [Sedimentisphaerales bacterium]
MTAILNQIAEKWFSWQLSMFWQVGLFIVIIAGQQSNSRRAG